MGDELIVECRYRDERVVEHGASPTNSHVTAYWCRKVHRHYKKPSPYGDTSPRNCNECPIPAAGRIPDHVRVRPNESGSGVKLICDRCSVWLQEDFSCPKCGAGSRGEK